LPISNAKKALYPDANIMIKIFSNNYTYYDIYRKNDVNKTLELIAEEYPAPPSSQMQKMFIIKNIVLLEIHQELANTNILCQVLEELNFLEIKFMFRLFKPKGVCKY